MAFFQSLKQNFIAYRSSKVSDCIFEIHQLWQSGFTRVYSNCCCSCSFEAEIIKIGQSSHKMYINNIVDFQESTTILNACTKKSGNLLYASRKKNVLHGNSSNFISQTNMLKSDSLFELDNFSLVSNYDKWISSICDLKLAVINSISTSLYVPFLLHCTRLYIYIYIWWMSVSTHSHTHTHIYIFYIYIYTFLAYTLVTPKPETKNLI